MNRDSLAFDLLELGTIALLVGGLWFCCAVAEQPPQANSQISTQENPHASN